MLSGRGMEIDICKPCAGIQIHLDLDFDLTPISTAKVFSGRYILPRSRRILCLSGAVEKGTIESFSAGSAKGAESSRIVIGINSLNEDPGRQSRSNSLGGRTGAAEHCRFDRLRSEAIRKIRARGRC